MISVNRSDPLKRAVFVQNDELNWSVYLIETVDNTLYCGISNDVKARYQAHCAGKGAKYTRAHKPRALVWTELGHSYSSALKREYAVKKLSRQGKLALIAGAKS